MSTEQVAVAPTVGAVKQVAADPRSPLTASEITTSAKFIRGLYPSGADLHFKAITLQEPEKAQLAPYLDAEHNGQTTGHIDRKAFVNYIIRNTVSCLWTLWCYYKHGRKMMLINPQEKFHEAVVNLTQQKVEYHVRLGPNQHGPGDGEEVVLVEKIALADEKVKAEIAKLQLPEGTVVISDPWIYGLQVSFGYSLD